MKPYVAALFIGLLSINSHAIIFGQDDRQMLSQAPAKYAVHAQGVGMFFSKITMTEVSPGVFKQEAMTVKESLGVCSNERFAQAPAIPVACSGFLVGEDLLMTAGHCLLLNGNEVPQQADLFCENFIWAFDVDDLPGHKTLDQIPAENLYECERVIKATNDSQRVDETHIDFRADWALMKLKRKTKRPYYRVSADNVPVGTPMYNLGHQMGSLTMYTPGRKISDTALYHRTNIDAFGGASGAPTFTEDGVVRGILVSGYPESFIERLIEVAAGRKETCNAINHCDDEGKNCGYDDGFDIPGTHIQKINAEMVQLIELNK